MATPVMLEAIEKAIWIRQRQRVFGLKDVVHGTDGHHNRYRSGSVIARRSRDPTVGRECWNLMANALAEIINGLYKTGLTKACRPGSRSTKSHAQRLNWVAWFYHRRL
jgi:hypothetical protein